jgi:hypothetical protein
MPGMSMQERGQADEFWCGLAGADLPLLVGGGGRQNRPRRI